MNKLTSKLKNLSNQNYFFIWLVFHLAVIIFFAVTFLACHDRISINADLYNMLPKAFEEESIRKADEKLTKGSGQNVFILVSNKDFNEARKTAVQVYETLEKSDNFDSVSLYNDVTSLSDVLDYIYKYRWNLLTDENAAQISKDNGQTFSESALSKAYSAFTMMPMTNLEQDPFMLSETVLNNYLDAVQNSGTGMSVKDGVLASKYEDNWYIMIRGYLSKKGATLATKNNGITEIYSTCNTLAQNGTSFVYSGTPFHSHESSNSASKEISIIATISMLIVIVMLWLTFRSPKPLIFSVASICLSIITGFAATVAVFKNVHVLTLVFGTSLIGSCIDYSLHYFTQWAGNNTLKSGKEIREYLLPGLRMAIVSSCLCFLILLFAPFNLLRQMSLFCLVGIFSSFLTTVCVFPLLSLPQGNRSLKVIEYLSKKNLKMSGKVRYSILAAIFVVTFALLGIFHKNVRIQNNITKLYTMKGELLRNEALASKIIQYNPTGWFIIKGDTAEEVLENEEKFRKIFEDATEHKTGYLSTTLFVPSIASQKASRDACKTLLEKADEQEENLGYTSDDAKALIAGFNSSENDFITFENNNIPDFLLNSISSAWLGEINGKYYSVLVPSKILDAKLYRSLCENDENIFFINKMADINSDLDHLTKMVLLFFAAAYIVMFVILKFFYSFKQCFKIISVPLLIILVTSAIFAIFNIQLEFFSITGVILVFGLGLDYIIYMIENESHNNGALDLLDPFATFLSFLTTVISFGALAISSFKPVHLIGLTIFIGLTTAYVCSILEKDKE